MPSYIRKNKVEILRDALNKLQKNTPITSIAPGSVARALVEAVTNEISDFYDIMDYNLNQTLITTASGSSLDLIGSLYGTIRRQVNAMAALEAVTGSFYFYIFEPTSVEILIPDGTNVFPDISYLGQRYSYSVVGDTYILPGRTKAYASIRPNFIDDSYTAGSNTLIFHDAVLSTGTSLLCTNPKPINARPTYEDDESYRLRIIKSMRVASSGTVEAVRFAGLSVSGVRDVRIKQIATGLGTFEAVIIPDISQTERDVISKCIAAMELVRPVGVRMNAITPVRISVDITIQLISPAIANPPMRESMITRAQIAIQRYMNSLLPGDMVVYNKIIQSIFDSSELVKDVIIKKFSVNGIEVLRRNYQPESNQQLFPGNIIVEVASS